MKQDLSYSNIVDIVGRLQDTIVSQSGIQSLGIFIESNGYFTGIKFLGEYIWDSDNDERKYEKGKGYEDLEIFLKRRILELVTCISAITFKKEDNNEKDNQE